MQHGTKRFPSPLATPETVEHSSSSFPGRSARGTALVRAPPEHGIAGHVLSVLPKHVRARRVVLLSLSLAKSKARSGRLIQLPFGDRTTGLPRAARFVAPTFASHFSGFLLPPRRTGGEGFQQYLSRLATSCICIDSMKPLFSCNVHLRSRHLEVRLVATFMQGIHGRILFPIGELDQPQTSLHFISSPPVHFARPSNPRARKP